MFPARSCRPHRRLTLAIDDATNLGPRLLFTKRGFQCSQMFVSCGSELFHLLIHVCFNFLVPPELHFISLFFLSFLRHGQRGSVTASATAALHREQQGRRRARRENQLGGGPLLFGAPDCLGRRHRLRPSLGHLLPGERQVFQNCTGPPDRNVAQEIEGN